MPHDIRKVIAYVTRRRNGVTELLVFEHRNIPRAGVQVPAGTVEDGEDIAAAVVRELAEESGLSGLPMTGPIDVYVWEHSITHNRHHRHVFHFTAPDDLPDHWTLEPRGEGEEQHGYIFEFRWIPLNEAGTLAGDQGRSVRKLI
jgi:8-oxo-dGTP pyrophosphatase MutT (NUDIX family)